MFVKFKSSSAELFKWVNPDLVTHVQPAPATDESYIFFQGTDPETDWIRVKGSPEEVVSKLNKGLKKQVEKVFITRKA